MAFCSSVTLFPVLVVSARLPAPVAVTPSPATLMSPEVDSTVVTPAFIVKPSAGTGVAAVGLPALPSVISPVFFSARLPALPVTVPIAFAACIVTAASAASSVTSSAVIFPVAFASVPAAIVSALPGAMVTF